MKKIFFASILISLFLLSVTCALTAKTTTLTFATWLSPSHPFNSEAIPTWAKWVEEATKGEVKVKVENYVGHPKDLFNAVEDGTYAGSWSYHGYSPGRFVLTKSIELPEMVSDPEKASKIYWKVYQKYFLKAGEHEGLKLIGLFVHGPGQILMKTPIRSLAELKGKKIRVGGGIQGDIAKELAVVAVPAPGSKVYEILQTGIADGVFMPPGELKTLNLHEVVKQVYQMGEGMYLGSFGIFMNPDFLNSLSAKNREAILRVSKEKLSGLSGKIWRENDLQGYKVGKASNVAITKASSSDIKKFNAMALKFEKQWIKDAKKKYKNIDIQKALSELKSDLK